MEERTGWRGQNESQSGGEEKKNGRLDGAAETSKERAEWRRLQWKNLSILGLPKRKEWPQCHRESSWQERRSCPCQKKKNRAVCPEYQIIRGESQGGREPHLGEREGSERKHGVERVDSTVNEGKFQGGKGGTARRASLEQVERSMSGCVDAKALQDDLQSLGFTPCLAKPEIEGRLGDEEPAHKMTE